MQIQRLNQIGIIFSLSVALLPAHSENWNSLESFQGVQTREDIEEGIRFIFPGLNGTQNDSSLSDARVAFDHYFKLTDTSLSVYSSDWTQNPNLKEEFSLRLAPKAEQAVPVKVKKEEIKDEGHFKDKKIFIHANTDRWGQLEIGNKEHHFDYPRFVHSLAQNLQKELLVLGADVHVVQGAWLPAIDLASSWNPDVALTLSFNAQSVTQQGAFQSDMSQLKQTECKALCFTFACVGAKELMTERNRYRVMDHLASGRWAESAKLSALLSKSLQELAGLGLAKVEPFAFEKNANPVSVNFKSFESLLKAHSGLVGQSGDILGIAGRNLAWAHTRAAAVAYTFPHLEAAIGQSIKGQLSDWIETLSMAYLDGIGNYLQLSKK